MQTKRRLSLYMRLGYLQNAHSGVRTIEYMFHNLLTDAGHSSNKV
jgi:hypothetical protein